MGTTAPIMLIRQTDALPMLDVLRQAGAPTGKLVAEAGLPEGFEEGRDGFIPFRAMLRWAGLSALSQDIPDLCWRGVLHAKPDQLGGWGTAVARCTTLRRAILTFCERFKRDAPLMDLGLQIGDEYAWFWRSRPKSVIGWVGDEEGQQFALGAMIRVVRAAAGPDWVPSEIQLESAKAPWVFAIPELGASRVHLDCPVVGIAVPYDLLDRAAFWLDADGSETNDAARLLEAEETLAGSLQQALVSLLPAVQPSIGAVAEIAELSPLRFGAALPLRGLACGRSSSRRGSRSASDCFATRSARSPRSPRSWATPTPLI